VNVCDSSNATSNLNRKTRPSDVRASGSTAILPENAAERETFRYGRGLCERLVHHVATDSTSAVYQTLFSAESELQTVHRFTFPYRLSSQTHKAQEFLQAESNRPYLSIRVQPSTLLSAYKRIVRPGAPTKADHNGLTYRESGEKRIALLTSVDPQRRSETKELVSRLQSSGWACHLKYVLRIPSMVSVGTADCVLIDQQLELQENVSICDTVLKLRVCGFSGVIAVALMEGLRSADAIKDELRRSAVSADLVFTGPITDANIHALTVTLEKKCIARVLSKGGI
jgi:hypothetical protein